jgi:hypothetical protein
MNQSKKFLYNFPTVNKAKGLFNQSEITFFGLHFTENGVSLNEIKTKALNEFKVPNNASELHSFLGLVVYASRWIKDLYFKVLSGDMFKII